jgi:antitoxin component YwqK of YwqJK toxin-antitoxin module
MKFKSILIFSIFVINLCCFSQITDTLNITDKKGMKQGHWIKKYPNGHIQYDGYFKDNRPFGEFRRYFENDSLHSVLIFSPDGREAIATLYHPNGFKATEGKFINQLKEGKWKFFSSVIKDFLFSEEEYRANILEGLSVKYYPDGTLAEKVSYINNRRNGEWVQYWPDRKICLKANYINGKLEGSFVVYFDNDKPQYVGQYKNDARTGTWKIFNPDGSLKYNVDYIAGVAKNPEMFRKETEYLDSLEKNKGKIADPEKTGTLW